MLSGAARSPSLASETASRALPGIGQIAYRALSQGDIPFIMGYNMFLAILTVLGTLLSDIAYMIVDPRIKISK